MARVNVMEENGVFVIVLEAEDYPSEQLSSRQVTQLIHDLKSAVEEARRKAAGMWEG